MKRRGRHQPGARVSRAWLRIAAEATRSGDDTQDLAKQAQNPIANLISLPIQNNTAFNFGPRERTLNVLNIEPVVPFKLNENWNLITRTIVPLIHLPSLEEGDGSKNGLGDINPTFFLPTALAKDVLVGFGPDWGPRAQVQFLFPK